MANFSDIQTQLAVMVGAQSSDELPPAELAQVKSVINQMYRQCYSPIDGGRPSWSVQEIGVTFSAPVTVAMTVTAGSATFTSSVTDLSDDKVGSLIKLGNDVTRLASVTGTGGTLTHEVETSGVKQAKVYHNVHVLPANTVDVNGMPEWAGRGPLMPFNSVRDETRYRSVTPDFHSRAHSPGPSVTATWGGFEEGDPVFYYVDETIYDDQTILPRLAVYPLPKSRVPVTVRVNILPDALVEDEDEPKLPIDVVEDCLIPMARAKFAEITPRYNSQNVRLLVDDRRDAEKRLKTFAHKQKDRNRQLRLRRGY